MVGRGRSVALADPPGRQATAARHRKSAEIVSDARLDLASSRELVRRLAPDLIRHAFPEPSQHQTCMKAAQELGGSPDTFDRIINGFTHTPDLLMLVHVARIYEQKTGRVSPVSALIARILRGAA